MSNFTTWRSLVDGEEIGEIPDSAVYRFDAHSINATDGDSITSWQCDVTGDTITGDATYTNDGIDGEPAVYFNGTDDKLEDHSFIDITNPTIFYIVNVDDVSTRGHLTGRIDNEDGTGMRWEGGDDIWDVEVPNTFNDVGGDADSRLISHRVEGNGDITVRIDETQEYKQNNGSCDLQAMSLGYEAENDRRYYPGHLGLIEVHDEQLSDSEIEEREQELVDEWNLSI